MDRRNFLAELTAMAALSGTAVPAKAPAADRAPAVAAMPTIALGKFRVSRLVVGSNPINGNSYLGPHLDRHMREYFTVDRAAEHLLACERAGINTHQFSTSGLAKAEGIIRKVREQGSHLQFIALGRKREEIPAVVQGTQPLMAIVHHGGVTDRLFSEGKSGEVHDFVKAVHDRGLLAGVSAHNPECIQRIADEGWQVDFFMTCFYFLTRHSLQKSPPDAAQSDTLELVYPFYRNDPRIMTRVARQLKQPCFGFKILAAGRMCGDQTLVRNAFRFAFENMKPTDGVIVGMYPQFFDEVTANAQYARDMARQVS